MCVFLSFLSFPFATLGMYKDDIVHKNCYHNLTLRRVSEYFRRPNNCVSVPGQKQRLVQKSAPGLRARIHIKHLYKATVTFASRLPSADEYDLKLTADGIVVHVHDLIVSRNAFYTR